MPTIERLYQVLRMIEAQMEISPILSSKYELLDSNRKAILQCIYMYNDSNS